MISNLRVKQLKKKQTKPTVVYLSGGNTTTDCYKISDIVELEEAKTLIGEVYSEKREVESLTSGCYRTVPDGHGCYRYVTSKPGKRGSTYLTFVFMKYLKKEHRHFEDMQEVDNEPENSGILAFDLHGKTRASSIVEAPAK